VLHHTSQHTRTAPHTMVFTIPPNTPTHPCAQAPHHNV
jgi:hypothetical protein